jgi:hypothetical protein
MVGGAVLLPVGATPLGQRERGGEERGEERGPVAPATHSRIHSALRPPALAAALCLDPPGTPREPRRSRIPPCRQPLPPWFLRKPESCSSGGDPGFAVQKVGSRLRGQPPDRGAVVPAPPRRVDVIVDGSGFRAERRGREYLDSASTARQSFRRAYGPPGRRCSRSPPGTGGARGRRPGSSGRILRPCEAAAVPEDHMMRGTSPGWGATEQARPRSGLRQAGTAPSGRLPWARGVMTGGTFVRLFLFHRARDSAPGPSVLSDLSDKDLRVHPRPAQSHGPDHA